jgi:hypothetical protein
MYVGHRTLVAALLVVLTAASAHAQDGRADLRYAAPLPAVVSFTTVDTLETTTSGFPMGDMKTTGTVRSVSEVRFTPVDDGYAVAATLRELSGVMNTPMGSMPLSIDDGLSIDLTMGATGLDPEDMPASLSAMPAPGASAGEMMGPARAVAGIVGLPGRELRLGESWADTVHLSPTVEGLTMEMKIVTHGTYAADTVVDGRTLNVLRISGVMTMKATGSMQGMDINQDMTTTSDDTVLWDSARHIPMVRTGASEMTSESLLPQQGMTLRMSATTRSVTTAEPQG